MNIKELYWAAGFLEGEGSFVFYSRRRQYQIEAAQVQRQPIDRLKKLIGGHICLVKAKPPRSNYYRWGIDGKRAISWMMTLNPLMSPRRREQIAKVLSGWKEPDRPNSKPRIYCRFGHKITGQGRKRYCRVCHSIYDQKRRRPLMHDDHTLNLF